MLTYKINYDIEHVNSDCINIAISKSGLRIGNKKCRSLDNRLYCNDIKDHIIHCMIYNCIFSLHVFNKKAICKDVDPLQLAYIHSKDWFNLCTRQYLLNIKKHMIDYVYTFLNVDTIKDKKGMFVVIPKDKRIVKRKLVTTFTFTK